MKDRPDKNIAGKLESILIQQILPKSGEYRPMTPDAIGYNGLVGKRVNDHSILYALFNAYGTDYLKERKIIKEIDGKTFERLSSRGQAYFYRNKYFGINIPKLKEWIKEELHTPLIHCVKGYLVTPINVTEPSLYRGIRYRYGLDNALNHLKEFGIKVHPLAINRVIWLTPNPSYATWVLGEESGVIIELDNESKLREYGIICYSLRGRDTDEIYTEQNIPREVIKRIYFKTNIGQLEHIKNFIVEARRLLGNENVIVTDNPLISIAIRHNETFNKGKLYDILQNGDRFSEIIEECKPESNKAFSDFWEIVDQLYTLPQIFGDFWKNIEPTENSLNRNKWIEKVKQTFFRNQVC